jgi:hypothetical protein
MWTARSLHHSALRGGYGGHCCRALSRSQYECESGSPWPRRPKWAPTTVPFLGGTAHEGKSALNIALTSRSHLPFSLSPSAISRCPLSTAVVSPPIRCYSDPTFRGHSPLYSRWTHSTATPAHTFPFASLAGRSVEDARPRIANE